jgi:hypothetical protein
LARTPAQTRPPPPRITTAATAKITIRFRRTRAYCRLRGPLSNKWATHDDASG